MIYYKIDMLASLPLYIFWKYGKIALLFINKISILKQIGLMDEHSGVYNNQLFK